MNKYIKLKVCGLKHKNNIYAAIGVGVDYVGLIFYEKSPRYVVGTLYPEDVWFLPDEVEKIGVFVNASFEEVVRYAKLYQLDLIQLHGSETPAFCAALRNKGYTVMKAFGVDDAFDFMHLQPYVKDVDFFLFDTKTPMHGGSGESFNWEVLRNYTYEIPVFIGGGLGVSNINELLGYNFSFLHAVDMNSKLEMEPGLKNISQVEIAAQLVQDYNESI